MPVLYLARHQGAEVGARVFGGVSPSSPNALSFEGQAPR